MTTSPALTLRAGFEIELIAPSGSSRQTLAAELARRARGTVVPTFHADSEPSLVPGMGHFLTLTQAFTVVDADGREVCSLVDDATIVADLDPGVGPGEGWYRILTDEPRLLRLLQKHADPCARLQDVLGPVADLFGVEVGRVGRHIRVDDAAGATVALGAALTGERERVCEIVTPPLTEDHELALSTLLSASADLGFAVPQEAAVHIHLDASPFRVPAAAAALIRLFAEQRTALHQLFTTNPRCRRLGPLGSELSAVATHGPIHDDWATFRAAAHATRPTKFADINLSALFAPDPSGSRQDTVEIRLLPGTQDVAQILRHAQWIESLMLRCLARADDSGRVGALDPTSEMGELIDSLMLVEP